MVTFFEPGHRLNSDPLRLAKCGLLVIGCVSERPSRSRGERVPERQSEACRRFLFVGLPRRDPPVRAPCPGSASTGAGRPARSRCTRTADHERALESAARSGGVGDAVQGIASPFGLSVLPPRTSDRVERSSLEIRERMQELLSFQSMASQRRVLVTQGPYPTMTGRRQIFLAVC